MIKSIRYATNVLAEAGTLYARHTATVVGVSVILQAGYIVGGFAAIDLWGIKGLIALSVLSIIATQVTIGVMTLLVLQVRFNNQVPGIGTLLKAVLPRSLGLLGMSLIVGVTAGVLMAIGRGAHMYLIYVPGFYLSVLWSMSAPAMIAGRQGIIAGMQSSWALVRPYRGAVGWVVVLQSTIAVGGQIAAGHMADDAIEDLILAQAAVTALIGPWTALALAEMYMRLVGQGQRSATAVVDNPTSRAIAPTKVWEPKMHPGVQAPVPQGPYVPTYVPVQPAAPHAHAHAHAGDVAAQPAYAQAQPAYAQTQPTYAAAQHAAPHPGYGPQAIHAVAPPSPYAQPVSPGTPQPQPYATQPAFAQPAAPQPIYAAAPQAVQPIYAPPPQPAQPIYAAAPQPVQPYGASTTPAHAPPAWQPGTAPVAGPGGVPSAQAGPPPRSASVAPPGFG